MVLSDVCLSVAYIGPNSRTERPRKTKIGTEVVHLTRYTTFKVKRSKVKVTSLLWLVVLAGQHGHTIMVTCHILAGAMRTWGTSLGRAGIVPRVFPNYKMT